MKKLKLAPDAFGETRWQPYLSLESCSEVGYHGYN